MKVERRLTEEPFSRECEYLPEKVLLEVARRQKKEPVPKGACTCFIYLMTEIWLEWRLTEESVSIQEVCSNLM